MDILSATMKSLGILVIRHMKVCLICAASLYILAIIIAISVHLGSPSPGKSRKQTQAIETIEQMLERTSACDNSTYLELSSNNSQIQTACDAFLLKREEFYSIRKTKVSPYIHNFTITGNNICSSDTDMIVLIHSLHSYQDRRQAIRRTWGGAVQENTWPVHKFQEGIKVAFIFGTSDNTTHNLIIKEEAEKYGDVIQGTFRESYRNMTLKSLLGLKFVMNFCKGAKYLLKSDDDMIINFPYLMDILSERHMKRAIMGPLCVASKVLRKGKWQISWESFPFYYYPLYEAGSAYVITSDLVRDLYKTAEYVPQIFIDDVFITGILGKILNVTHIRQNGFAYWVNKLPKADDILKNKIVTGTRVNPEQQLQLWNAIKTRN